MILFIIFILLVVFVPFVRFVLGNIHNFTFYTPRDIVDYFKYKRYNECKNYGYIKVFNGYFGSGKSLSAVNEVVDIYRRYNGAEIYIPHLQCFMAQKITIISNLKLFGVPYIPFISERQFIDYEVAENEVVIFLIDEIGTVWNNRDFKDFNPDVFNNIVQSRKRKMAIYGTLPVFQGTDINVRRFTSSVVYCNKWWRIIKLRTYDARDVENCSNVELIQPLSVKYMFVRDLMYNQYDTTELVDKLKLDMEEGRLLTFNELNTDNSTGNFKFANVKKKFKKLQRGV